MRTGEAIKDEPEDGLWVGLASVAFTYYAVDAFIAVRSGSDASARAARDLLFLPIAAAAVAGSGAIGRRMRAGYAAEPEGRVSGVLLFGGVLVFGAGLGLLTGGISMRA
jgi:hypothetical protein